MPGGGQLPPSVRAYGRRVDDQSWAMRDPQLVQYWFEAGIARWQFAQTVEPLVPGTLMIAAGPEGAGLDWLAGSVPGACWGVSSCPRCSTERLNSRIPWPRALPSSGSFPGPKMISAMIRTTI